MFNVIAITLNLLLGIVQVSAQVDKECSVKTCEQTVVPAHPSNHR